jgi:hypothetical protein
VIVEPATILSESGQWAVLKISKSCWVVISQAELAAGLRRGKAWRRYEALRAWLEAMTVD